MKRVTVVLSLLLLVCVVCFILTGCSNSIAVPRGEIVAKRYEKPYLASFSIFKIKDPRNVSGYMVLVQNEQLETQWFYVSEEYYLTAEIGDFFVYNSTLHEPV